MLQFRLSPTSKRFPSVVTTVRPVASRCIAAQPRFDRDLQTWLQRLRVETAPLESARGGHFNRPRRHGADSVGRFQVHPDVRIQDFHAGDDTGQGHHVARVVDRGQRMMCREPCCTRRDEHESRNVLRIFIGSPHSSKDSAVSGSRRSFGRRAHGFGRSLRNLRPMLTEEASRDRAPICFLPQRSRQGGRCSAGAPHRAHPQHHRPAQAVMQRQAFLVEGLMWKPMPAVAYDSQRKKNRAVACFLLNL